MSPYSDDDIETTVTELFRLLHAAHLFLTDQAPLADLDTKLHAAGAAWLWRPGLAPVPDPAVARARDEVDRLSRCELYLLDDAGSTAVRGVGARLAADMIADDRSAALHRIRPPSAAGFVCWKAPSTTGGQQVNAAHWETITDEPGPPGIWVVFWLGPRTVTDAIAHALGDQWTERDHADATVLAESVEGLCYHPFFTEDPYGAEQHRVPAVPYSHLPDLPGAKAQAEAAVASKSGLLQVLWAFWALATPEPGEAAGPAHLSRYCPRPSQVDLARRAGLPTGPVTIVTSPGPLFTLPRSDDLDAVLVTIEEQIFTHAGQDDTDADDRIDQAIGDVVDRYGADAVLAALIGGARARLREWARVNDQQMSAALEGLLHHPAVGDYAERYASWADLPQLLLPPAGPSRLPPPDGEVGEIITMLLLCRIWIHVNLAQLAAGLTPSGAAESRPRRGPGQQRTHTSRPKAKGKRRRRGGRNR